MRSNATPASPGNSLATRVLWLIGLVNGGNVSAAARAISTASGIVVSQPTLARICDGLNTSPRSETVRALCAYYNATADWLLYGTGPSPQDIRPAEERDLAAFIASLDLPQASVAVLSSIPMLGCFVLPDALSEAAQHGRSVDEAAIGLLMMRFIAAQRIAWHAYLSGILDCVGRDNMHTAFDPPREWVNRLDALFLMNVDRLSYITDLVSRNLEGMVMKRIDEMGHDRVIAMIAARSASHSMQISPPGLNAALATASESAVLPPERSGARVRKKTSRSNRRKA